MTVFYSSDNLSNLTRNPFLERNMSIPKSSSNPSENDWPFVDPVRKMKHLCQTAGDGGDDGVVSF